MVGFTWLQAWLAQAPQSVMQFTEIISLLNLYACAIAPHMSAFGAHKLDRGQSSVVQDTMSEDREPDDEEIKLLIAEFFTEHPAQALAVMDKDKHTLIEQFARWLIKRHPEKLERR
jgi:hypothetical protein